MPIEVTVQVIGEPDSDYERDNLRDSLGLNERATDAEIIAALSETLEASIREDLERGCQ